MRPDIVIFLIVFFCILWFYLMEWFQCKKFVNVVDNGILNFWFFCWKIRILPSNQLCVVDVICNFFDFFASSWIGGQNWSDNFAFVYCFYFENYDGWIKWWENSNFETWMKIHYFKISKSNMFKEIHVDKDENGKCKKSFTKKWQEYYFSYNGKPKKMFPEKLKIFENKRISYLFKQITWINDMANMIMMIKDSVEWRKLVKKKKEKSEFLFKS